MRNIRAGIVGCGKVGHYHARAYRAASGCELAACVSRSPERAEEFGRAYGIPWFTSVREMVEKTGVEAVSIATPHPQHAAPAVEAARAGAHILVEKPLAASLRDCDAILSAVRAAGVTAGVVSQRRFYPQAARVKQAIEDEKLGKPILGTVTMLGWRDMAYYASDPWRGTWAGEGGGVLVNQAPHQLDLLLWYMGEVAELYGLWDTLNHPGLEVDDTAVAAIRFRSGALGTVVVSNSQNPALYGNVHIHGSSGASVGVQTDGGAMFVAGMSGITEPPFNDLWTIPGEEHLKAVWRNEEDALFSAPDAVDRFFRLQIMDFLGAIREGRAPLVTLEDGRRTAELFTAIYRSSRNRAPIRFPLEA